MKCYSCDLTNHLLSFALIGVAQLVAYSVTSYSTASLGLMKEAVMIYGRIAPHKISVFVLYPNGANCAAISRVSHSHFLLHRSI